MDFKFVNVSVANGWKDLIKQLLSFQLIEHSTMQKEETDDVNSATTSTAKPTLESPLVNVAYNYKALVPSIAKAHTNSHLYS